MKNISYGSWGSDVRQLQINLTKLGYGKLMGTGFFGTKTLEVVKNFQKQNNLIENGIIDSSAMLRIGSQLSKSKRELLWETAISHIGTDITPNDIVPDEVGCAEAVNKVHELAFGVQIGGGASTYNLYNCLLKHPSFIKVDEPLFGDIVISPTGYGNGGLSNGHVGIISKDRKIMSNNSYTGCFEENYTLESWKARYVDKGGYPMDYFRKI